MRTCQVLFSIWPEVGVVHITNARRTNRLSQRRHAVGIVLLCAIHHPFSLSRRGWPCVLCKSKEPHCSAIARAIPSKVLLLIFHLSGVRGNSISGLYPTLARMTNSLPCLFPRGSTYLIPFPTICVGRNSGSSFSHRHVFFVHSWPCCQGSIIWSGFRTRLDTMPTGFSTAMCGIGAKSISLKNARASSCTAGPFALNHRAPDTAR